MIPQIMQIKIRLAESEKEYKEISFKVTRLMHEMNTCYNPWFGEDVESIKAEEVKQIGADLVDCKTRLIELKALITELKRELG